jgi:dTDP-4-amino-4,6-dideoxygalactose transaminase
LVEADPLGYHVYHLFVIRVGDRDGVKAALAEHGVHAGVHYPLACHQQPAFVPFAQGPLPNSELAATEVLSLPLYPHMSLAQVDAVAELLGHVVAGKSAVNVAG